MTATKEGEDFFVGSVCAGELMLSTLPLLCQIVTVNEPTIKKCNTLLKSHKKTTHMLPHFSSFGIEPNKVCVSVS